MSRIYSPKGKIVIASSTEGVVWDGAKECYLVTHNAAVDNGMYKMKEPFDSVIKPQEFTQNREEFLKTKYFKAALQLRPLVKKAWHYFIVLDMINENPDWTDDILSDPENEKAYEGFINKFKSLKETTLKRSQEHYDKIFYEERNRMKKRDTFAWLDLYEPIDNRWDEFGKLAETKKFDGDGNLISGFIPAFATSKDEDSSNQLCIHFVRTQKLDKKHYSPENADVCTVPRNLIVGKDRVPTRNKIHQLDMLRSIMDIPKTQVWNFNDMYFREELEDLWQHFYRFNFFLPGYVFPFDIEKARNDPLVVVLEENFSEQLGKVAYDMGL